MRHYKNTATGAEIFTENEIHGENWIEVVPPPVKADPLKEPAEESAKKAGKKTKK